jgi:glycosyltransferase involved in cell wall biosynthesis
MAEAGCPAVLLQQENEQMRAHGTEQYRGALPDNVRLVMHEGDLRTFIAAIARARIVVIPRYRDDIGCTGISTYLVAMALGKCVVISRGAGAEDVLTDEAVFVEPENPQALARQVEELWSDDTRCRALGAKAKRYAESCGGTRRLATDVLNTSLELLATGKARRVTGPAAAA